MIGTARASSLVARLRRRRPGLSTALLDRVPANSTCAVLTDNPQGAATQLRRHGAHVHVVASTGSAAHAELTALAPFDLIVDERGRKNRVIRFRDAFFHLRAGGMYVVRGGAGESGAAPTKLAEYLNRAEHARAEPWPGRGRGIPTAALDAYGLSQAMVSFDVDGEDLVVTRGDFPVLAKLREDEMAQVLQRRNGRDKVLEVIPAAPFDSRCEFTENSPERRPNFHDHYDTIDLSLRLYHEAIAVPAGVLVVDNMITPDSYRHNQFKRLRNRATDEIAPRFAVLRTEGGEETPYLEGAYVHLDNEQRGHFGHLVTEQMSRFWSWQRAKELYPDAKALVAINKGRELRGWELEIYAAGGIPADDIVFTTGPVRVERIVSGTPMLSNPDYVHPAIQETWQSVGNRLVAGSGTDADLPRRFFCSRRLAKRSCHNSPDVEALFSDFGFDIVYPEDLPLGDQVRLFRNAEVIGGFVGSAMFSLAYASDPKQVILVGSSAYTARNEYLFAALLGHRIDSVVSTPDDPTTYQSPYTFNLADEGNYLRTLLDNL